MYANNIAIKKLLLVNQNVVNTDLTLIKIIIVS
jgi:hypothetical protein